MASFNVDIPSGNASPNAYSVTVSATSANSDTERFLGTLTYKTADGVYEKVVNVYQDGTSNFNPDSIDPAKGALVDLGLPSGTLWMNKNIGATNPEDVGNRYGWGEPISKSGDLDDFTPENYRPGYISDTNYVSLYDYEPLASTIASKACHCLSGKPMFDPCQAYYGTSQSSKMCVRMPIYNQVYELYHSCDVVLVTINGKPGYRFTSKYNGASIFIPISVGPLFDDTKHEYSSSVVGTLNNYCAIRVGGSEAHAGMSGVYQRNGVNEIIPNGDRFGICEGLPVRACTAGKFVSLQPYAIGNKNPRFQGIPTTRWHEITSNDGWGHTSTSTETWEDETKESNNVYKTVIISVFDPANKGWYPVCDTSWLSFKVVARQYGQEAVSEMTTADGSLSNMSPNGDKFVGNGYIEVTCNESNNLVTNPHAVNNTITLLKSKGSQTEYDSFTFKYVGQTLLSVNP